MDKSVKIFVAGARGLVGSALVRELNAQGYNNLLTPPSTEIDLLDANEVRWYFSVNEPTHVFFAAARVGGIADNVAHPVEFLADNLQMELNVISNAAVFECRKLIFLSTSCCYPRDCPQPMQPQHLWSGPLEKTTEPYAVAKLAGMALCKYHNFISVLPCNIFGPRDNFDPEKAHCLPGMLARMDAAKRAGDPSFHVWGRPEVRREFLFSEDLARGLIIAMEKHVGPAPLNLGSGQELTMSELADALAGIVGYTGRIEFDSEKPAGTPRKLLDSAPARALGWTLQVPFLEALKTTYECYRSVVSS
jgi:GDP-L-fucose synthase